MNDAERLRIVVDNLAARVGQLTAENLELLVRVHALEHPDDDAGDDGGKVEP